MLVDDNGDAQTDEAVAELCVSSFLKRPGTDPVAVDMISRFMNNIVLARRTPSRDFSYNAAALFLMKDQAIWWLSGDASVMLFAEGKPTHFSEAKQYPLLGNGPGYRCAPSENITLEKASAALFMCAGKAPSPDEIADLLADSETPEEWMAHITKAFGEQLNCAMTAFLPPPKKGGLPMRKPRKPHKDGGER